MIGSLGDISRRRLARAVRLTPDAAHEGPANAGHSVRQTPEKWP